MMVPFALLIIVASIMLGAGFAGGLLCKTITDGVGKWVADWLTDRRREKKSKRQAQESLDSLRNDLGSTWDSLKENIAEHPEVRDVLLAPKTLCYNWSSPHVRYDEDGREHQILLNKFRLLEDKGCVEYASSGDLIAYRLTEDFVKLLSQE